MIREFIINITTLAQMSNSFSLFFLYSPLSCRPEMNIMVLQYLENIMPPFLEIVTKRLDREVCVLCHYINPSKYHNHQMLYQIINYRSFDDWILKYNFGDLSSLMLLKASHMESGFNNQFLE